MTPISTGNNVQIQKIDKVYEYNQNTYIYYYV